MTSTQRAALVNPGEAAAPRWCRHQHLPGRIQTTADSPSKPFCCLVHHVSCHACHQWPVSLHCTGREALPGPGTELPPLWGTKGHFPLGSGPGPTSQTTVWLSAAPDLTKTEHAVTAEPGWDLPAWSPENVSTGRTSLRKYKYQRSRNAFKPSHGLKAHTWLLFVPLRKTFLMRKLPLEAVQSRS